MLLALGTIKEHVVPVCRVKVLDRLELEAGGLDVAPHRDHLLQGPEFVGIARETPAAVSTGGLVVVRLLSVASEIVDEVGDDVGSARLPRELEVLAGEHVPIEAKAELHRVQKQSIQGNYRQLALPEATKP
jgi:hypothetical protein